MCYGAPVNLSGQRPAHSTATQLVVLRNNRITYIGYQHPQLREAQTGRERGSAG